MSVQFDVIKKVCLLGDPAVGKTSLIKKYVYDVFDDTYITTIGTKVSKKEVQVTSNIKVTLLIWDVLGQDEYQFLHATYYQGSAAGLIVCDGTRQDTIAHVKKWVTNFRATVGNVPVIILVNKSDLLPPDFKNKELDDIAAEAKAKCIFTSAKSGKNVEESFKALTQAIADAL